MKELFDILQKRNNKHLNGIYMPQRMGLFLKLDMLKRKYHEVNVLKLNYMNELYCLVSRWYLKQSISQRSKKILMLSTQYLSSFFCHDQQFLHRYQDLNMFQNCRWPILFKNMPYRKWIIKAHLSLLCIFNILNK